MSINIINVNLILILTYLRRLKYLFIFNFNIFYKLFIIIIFFINIYHILYFFFHLFFKKLASQDRYLKRWF